MFSKLLKHEFKAQRGIFSVLSLAALGAGLLGGLLMWLILSLAENTADETSQVLGIVFASMLLVVIMIAIIAYSVGVTILLIYRFYKHHFSDEGYLTFTLPATTHQILLSSITNIAIWNLLSTCVVLLAMFFILMPLLQLGVENGMLFSAFEEVWQLFIQEFGSGMFVMQAFSVVATFIYSLILPLLSVTIGSLVAKKHKLLAAFGVGYGISALLSVVSGILSTITLIGDFAISEASGETTLILSILIPSLLYLAIGIGGYFIMHQLVDKKLNLP